jgi:hypothetical protein
METTKIKVPENVLEGLEAVRKSGATNMLDRNMVARLAMDMKFYETALWIDEHKKEYAEGIFKGFVVE